MSKNRFKDVFGHIACSLFGREHGTKITIQFGTYSASIVPAMDIAPASPCYDFFSILKVLTYMDNQILFGRTTCWLTTVPYKENGEQIEVILKDFWHLRRLFYAGNGVAPEIAAKDNCGVIKIGAYELLLSDSIYDYLPVWEQAVGQDTIFNHSIHSTAYKRKLDAIFKKFRTLYEGEYRKIKQAEFTQYVWTHITTDVADHDLKAMWRCFADGSETVTEELTENKETLDSLGNESE
ncbi:hypothetical protein Cva_00089 [Caedimonas varicaedens]|uniref:Uncharacterized protein n=1 Tax=Caedimonas varicaedens TaxID=1629334 RepID=A0A0K8MAK3_9PROT|nr:hypothetical protein Cva_00089 [Caedimonas varicaedens]